MVGSRQTSRDVVSTYLMQRMGFDARAVAAIDAGRAVARTLDGFSAEDVAVVGAVRIRGTPSALVARLRDIVTFERSATVLQIGKFGQAPTLSDFNALTLEPDDLTALRACATSDCDLQLPADVMQRFRSEIAWRSPAAHATANALMRKVLVDLVMRYQAQGNDGLGRYDDSNPPVRVAEEFRLLGSGRDMLVPLPELTTYLAGYPRAPLRSAEDFFYWTKVDFGLKPTIRMNHVTIWPLPDRRDGLRYVVATKQLYASHYFSTALELRYLVEDPARPGQGFVLLLVGKSRVPGLSGPLGGVIRMIVRGRATSSMEGHLNHTKKLVEARY
jgi:hypothetical protein